MTTQLLPCPFCGDLPTFTDWVHKDDRRYVAMELECCVTMKSSISWPDYAKMPDALIDEQLKADLTKDWNTRVDTNKDETND